MYQQCSQNSTMPQTTTTTKKSKHNPLTIFCDVSVYVCIHPQFTYCILNSLSPKQKFTLLIFKYIISNNVYAVAFYFKNIYIFNVYIKF